MLRSQLERSGHVVRSVRDRASCLDVLQSSLVDLLVVDLDLAGTSSLEALKAVTRPQLAGSVVAFTGAARGEWDELVEAARAAGAICLIQKSCDAGHVLAAVRSALSRAPGLRSASAALQVAERTIKDSVLDS
ncbi:MAG: response regulator [Nitrospiraceae bacterium]